MARERQSRPKAVQIRRGVRSRKLCKEAFSAASESGRLYVCA